MLATAGLSPCQLSSLEAVPARQSAASCPRRKADFRSPFSSVPAPPTQPPWWTPNLSQLCVPATSPVPELESWVDGLLGLLHLSRGPQVCRAYCLLSENSHVTYFAQFYSCSQQAAIPGPVILPFCGCSPTTCFTEMVVRSAQKRLSVQGPWAPLQVQLGGRGVAVPPGRGEPPECPVLIKAKKKKNTLDMLTPSLIKCFCDCESRGFAAVTAKDQKQLDNKQRRSFATSDPRSSQTAAPALKGALEEVYLFLFTQFKFI